MSVLDSLQLPGFMADPATGGDSSNPRRVARGTSYSAKGQLVAPADILNEKGSAQGSRSQDPVPALRNRSQALKVYDQMASTDSGVSVSLRAAKAGVLGADFYFEPFDEKPQNVEIAEFCQYNLLEGLNQPWLGILEDILRMMEDGASVFETVWEIGEWAPRRTMANIRKYTLLKKLGFRPATTISEFTYDDNGGPAGVVHQAIRADKKVETIEIPIEKLIIFSFNKKGGNLEGQPVLRSAYKHWYYKDNLYKIDAIQKERHAIGIPIINLLGGYTEADVTAAWNLVRNLRTNERAGAVLPPGYELMFAELGNQPVDVLPSIEHHEGRILLNLMVQFLLLGLSAGGGRATSGSHLDMFQKSLRHIGKMICDTFNLYLIPRLVGYNFQTSEFPRLKVRNIGETKDLQMWASAMANLASQNLITLDYETEQFVREVVDMPRKVGGRQTPENNAGGSGIIDPSTGQPFGAANSTTGAKNNGSSGKGGVASGKPNNGTGSKNSIPGSENA